MVGRQRVFARHAFAAGSLLTVLAGCTPEPVWTVTLDGETTSGRFTYHLFGLEDDLFVDGYESADPPPSERNVWVVRLAGISDEPTVDYVHFYDLAIGLCTPVAQETDLVGTDPTVELHVDATVTCSDLRPGEELALRLDIGS
jgi:hypothetical protein